MIEPVRGRTAPPNSSSVERYDASQLIGLTVAARDGEIGKVSDIYFDDKAWAVRYLVIDTGGWLTGRKVLVSPYAVERVAVGEYVMVDLTRTQVEESPDYDSDKPVSRQYEVSYYSYYGYPGYWMGPYAWGMSLYPGPMSASPSTGPAAREVDARLEREREQADPHLRSMKEVRGYGIEARDGALGHIESFLVDARSWEIAGLVLDTRNWLPGKHVAVSTAVVGDIDWGEDRVIVTMSREELKSLPEYDSP